MNPLIRSLMMNLKRRRKQKSWGTYFLAILWEWRPRYKCHDNSYYLCTNLQCLQSAKQDWISGEVDIPTFHCPRCRDHWYGVSSVPCDEELARLIREGLWQTGNSSKDTKNTRNAREFSLESTKNNKSEAFYSGGRLQARIPSLKSNTYRNKSNSDLDNWEMKRGKEALGEKRNRKKRITFHLDNNDANNDDDADGATGSRESGTQLQGLVEEGPYTGSGEEGAGNGSIGEASGISGIVSSVGSEVVEDATSGDISGEHNIIVGTGRQSGDTYTDGSKDGPNFTRDDNLRKASSQAADHDTTKEAKGSGKLTSHQQREASHGKGGGLSGLEDDWRGNMGAVEDVELRGSGSGRGRQTGAVGDGMSEDREGVDRKQEHVSELENGEALDGSENENNRNRSSHRNGNQSPSTSTGSGKTPGSEKVENSLTKLTHYGKRVRKNGGYMRAVSPTSSKWGDPLHARSFLSSTSTGVSRTPSTSSLTQDNNTSSSSSGELGFRTKKGSQFLPPIVNPIHSSPFTSIEGPSITRPWIFSYH